MSWEFGLRLVGMVIAAILGAQLGREIADTPNRVDFFALVFGLVGIIAGLVITPYLTTRPAKYLQRQITTAPTEIIVVTVLGLLLGLIIAALIAVPLSQLPIPLNQWTPTLVAGIAAYVIAAAAATRAGDIGRYLGALFRPADRTEPEATGAQTRILLDTSVIIDGRILDISKSGFLIGRLFVPRFVLAELQHIADSADVLKRARGRRGLEVLDQLQKETGIFIEIIDTDIEGVREVDDKLVLVARQMNAHLMTNDYNLNGIAKLQGIPVMNINDLANAVKASYLPGQSLSIHIIQEGRELNQGVGYLVDGTMVVVEDGKKFMDRTTEVIVTRMIQTAAGKMYFAKPGQTP